MTFIFFVLLRNEFKQKLKREFPPDGDAGDNTAGAKEER
jgi:hypothetical protein